MTTKISGAGFRWRRRVSVVPMIVTPSMTASNGLRVASRVRNVAPIDDANEIAKDTPRQQTVVMAEATKPMRGATLSADEVRRSTTAWRGRG